MLKGFREFILRGNAIDLAVGVVVGAAFTAVVTAIVNGFISPLVGAIFGQPNFDSVGQFSIGAGDFNIGIILTALLNFLLVGLALYFVIIVPLNKVNALRKPKPAEAAVQENELQVLKNIEKLLEAQQNK